LITNPVARNAIPRALNQQRKPLSATGAIADYGTSPTRDAA
jgi:hypothetical protein